MQDWKWINTWYRTERSWLREYRDSRHGQRYFCKRCKMGMAILCVAQRHAAVEITYKNGSSQYIFFARHNRPWTFSACIYAIRQMLGRCNSTIFSEPWNYDASDISTIDAIHCLTLCVSSRDRFLFHTFPA